MLIQTIIVFLFIFLSSSKIFESEVHLTQFKTNNGWFYLTKMSLEKGIAEIKLQT